MNRIPVLLILLFMPIGIAAQQPVPFNTFATEYNPDKSVVKVNQQSSGTTQIWLNIGPGIGSSGSPSAIASVSYQFDGNLLSLRASTTGELLGDHISDIGLLYGRATSNDSFHTSLAAGIARISGQRSEGLFGTTEEVSPTAGIPLELQSYWKPASFFGIGVTGFANINAEQSFAGIALSVQLGKLQ